MRSSDTPPGNETVSTRPLSKYVCDVSRVWLVLPMGIVWPSQSVTGSAIFSTTHGPSAGSCFRVKVVVWPRGFLTVTVVAESFASSHTPPTAIASGVPTTTPSARTCFVTWPDGS